MTPGWPTRRLGDVLTIQNGFAFDSKLFSRDSGVPLIRIRDLRNGVVTDTRYTGAYDDKYLVRAADLLVGMDGEFGCYEWRGDSALLNQRVCRFQGFGDALLPRFLFYGVRSHLKAIEDVTGFATVKHLSSRQILDIPFPMPPLVEQKRIVAILDQAFHATATAKASASLGLENAHGFLRRFVDSLLAAPGDGWTDAELGSLCSIARGGSPRPIQEYLTADADGINWVRISDATASGKYIFRTAQRIRREGLARSREVHDGDFLLSNSMSFGRPYIMRTTGCVHDGWLVLSDYAEHLDQDYLYYVLGSGSVYGQFDKLAAGSTVRNLNIALASRVRIPVPPLATQHEIVGRLERAAEHTDRLASIYQRKLAALDELKASLLHAAFSGDL